MDGQDHANRLVVWVCWWLWIARIREAWLLLYCHLTMIELISTRISATPHLELSSGCPKRSIFIICSEDRPEFFQSSCGLPNKHPEQWSFGIVASIFLSRRQPSDLYSRILCSPQKTHCDEILLQSRPRYWPSLPPSDRLAHSASISPLQTPSSIAVHTRQRLMGRGFCWPLHETRSRDCQRQSKAAPSGRMLFRVFCASRKTKTYSYL